MPVQILFKRRRREARLPPRPLLCSYLETEVGAEQEGLRLARNIAVSALVDSRDIIFVEQIVGVCAQLEIVVHGTPSGTNLRSTARLRHGVNAPDCATSGQSSGLAPGNSR